MTYTHKWNARDKCYDIMPMDLSRVMGQEITRVEADKAVKLLNLKERQQDLGGPAANPSLQLVLDAVECAGTQKALAAVLETHATTVSSWVRGDAAPSRIYQARIRVFLMKHRATTRG